MPWTREYGRLWRSKHLERVQQIALKSYYKRKIDRYNYPTWWLCDACNVPIARKTLLFDHNHRTGEFRGWLCSPCNTTLGRIESPRFELVLKYLARELDQ